MTELPKYVSYEPDRHGNPRWYYRRGGHRTRLDGRPGEEIFDRSYRIQHLAYEQPSLAPRRKVNSFVYFLRYGNRRVKIGTCVNVKSRLQQLKTGIPGKPVVHYVTPGGRKLESELHRIFAEDRISGEWFQFSAAIRRWIWEDESRRRKERGVNEKGPDFVAPPRGLAVALSSVENISAISGASK